MCCLWLSITLHMVVYTRVTLPINLRVTTCTFRHCPKQFQSPSWMREWQQGFSMDCPFKSRVEKSHNNLESLKIISTILTNGMIRILFRLNRGLQLCMNKSFYYAYIIHRMDNCSDIKWNNKLKKKTLGKEGKIARIYSVFGWELALLWCFLVLP